MELLILLALAVGCAFASAYIFQAKGRSFGGGFALGFLLGLIGLVIALFVSDRTEEAEAEPERRQDMYRDCPHCKEPMRRDASVCPHCRNASPAWTWDGERWWHEGRQGRFWLDEQANTWRPEQETAAQLP